MYSNKLRKGIKDKLGVNGVWVNTQSGEALTANDILVGNSTDYVVNNCLFNKVFYKYIQSMKGKDLKVRGMFILWVSAGLSENNTLSDERLTDFKKTISRPTYEGYINTMIKEKMIARKKRGVYVCNPNIALFGKGVNKDVFLLFTDKP